MSTIPHKPIRLTGRPRGKQSRRCRVTNPVLSADNVEYKTQIVRDSGKQCVQLLRCVAGVCKVIFDMCEGGK